MGASPTNWVRRWWLVWPELHDGLAWRQNTKLFLFDLCATRTFSPSLKGPTHSWSRRCFEAISY